ncbi:TetR family transcriptional regulator [Pseudomonas matsuisoli]|uniref:TetR family transcriptional regulator n=1 Tax=Pseudomonas matsuisoli TaxID=1515666 RepID=A0A917Q0C8_9PSED|nr:TetR family transcriptional regulator [Pseudomonas matsuisoli]GGK04822.1 TetR family transcriptional regulator [Pseudomonas matsuisoli]
MARRTKEEALETRSHIIDAAEHCFYVKGVSRTTMADIANAAGVTRGAIYWHFENKTDVFDAMLNRVTQPLEPLSEATRNENEPDPLGRTRELLIKVLHDVVHDRRNRRIHEIMFHKCEYTDELGDLRGRMEEERRECDLEIEASLRNSISKGQLPDDLDVTLAAFCMHSYIAGLLDQWLLIPDAFDLDRYSAQIVDSCLDMLRLSPALRIKRNES